MLCEVSLVTATSLERAILWPIAQNLGPFEMDENSPVNSERYSWEDLRKLDPQVLSSLHDEYFPQLYRYARYRTRDEGLAEDIASEVFLRLLSALRKGRGPRSSLRGWLFGTASNLIHDHFRRQYNRPTEPLSGVESAGQATAPNGLFAVELREDLSAALARLTEAQQEVLSLRFGANLSLAETAEIMNRRPNAIKALQHRALATLRDHMGLVR